MQDAAKYFIAVLSAAGLLGFSFVFVATFAARPVLEDAMNGFVRSRVHQEVRERLGSATGTDATLLKEWFEESAESAADFLENQLDPFVDRVLDSCSASEDPDKEFIARWAKAAQRAVEQGIEQHFAIAAELEHFIRGKYTEIVHALMSEIRIFTGINAGLFAAVLALLFARWRQPGVVLVPAALLLVATAVCVAVYIFGQNWFFSIFLQDYAGHLYLAYVAVVFGLLMDIAFNRARVTRMILEIPGAVLGS